MFFRRAIFFLLAAIESLGAQDATRLNAESRRFSDQIATAPNKAGKKAAAEKSLELARRAVAADPSDSEAHLTLAIALGKMTDFTSSRVKMEYARLIRQEAEIALKLDSQNDFACLVLGKWHDEMSRLNPVLKAIATTVFGELPSASATEAEKYLRRAAQLGPTEIRHHAELAIFLDLKSRHQEAREGWQKVLSLEPKDVEDREFRALAQKQLR